MENLKKYLSFINHNLLFILSTFLIAFIPLFPKIPIFDILPGYIVRVRAEDFLIFITALVWLRDAYQKKFNWNTTFFWMVLAYAIVGATSITLGTLLSFSIPQELLHIGKSGLHFFRYLEYFALFFFLYSSITTKKQIQIVLVTLVFTLIGIIGYGFGQQYFHFPLYSTMNREYSKGEKLYLQENARPQSTFAGHYDLGAYLVIILPLIFALSINKFDKNVSNIKETKRWQTLAQLLTSKQAYLRLFLHTTHLFGAWMLVSSGSKTALAAYLTGILIVLFFYLKKMAGFKQQLKWGIISLVSLTIILGLVLAIFGQQTESALLSIAQKSSTANKIISRIPGVTITENSSDPTRPEDLYGEGHEFQKVTKQDEYGIDYQTTERVDSIWSANALKYGISMGIRLDTLWPQAIKGLINNPLFGNGYGTLSAPVQGQFIEADSTDNNFLRTLGETGILGFVVFYGLILFILIIVYKNTNNSNPLIATLNIGFVGSIVGLLINASYIDVFAASKVAFTFWALAGISVKSGLIDSKSNAHNSKLSMINSKDDLLKLNPVGSRILNHFKKHRAFYLAFLLFFFLLHKNPYKENSLIRNFSTSNQAIENVVAARCFISTGSFNVCRSNGLVLKENSNIYSWLLVPFLRISSDPATFYFLNLSILLIIFIVVYQLIFKMIAQRNQLAFPNLPAFPNLIIFSSMSLLTLNFYLLSATLEPLTNDNLILLLVLIPILSISLSLFLVRKSKQVSLSLQLILLIFITASIFKHNFIFDIKTSFRNNQVAYQNWAIRRSDIHLLTKFPTEYTGNNYLITTINPYYFDFYTKMEPEKTSKYDVLPMSEHQPYFNQANKVWKNLTSNSDENSSHVDLLQTYQEIINRGDGLYISDFGIYQNSNYLNSFNQIKNEFDLRYQVIDCDEQCNVYNLTKETKKVSDLPTSINNQVFNLNKLSGEYNFSVLSHRYSPSATASASPKPSYLPHNTKTLIDNLNSSGLDKNQQTFMIFTGDILHVSENSWKAYFDKEFGNLVGYPILYNSGNYDLLPTKQYPSSYHRFFSQNDYFLFLNLGEESTIDEAQKLFAYNSFLELEKLPDIKNLFIIAHNLDWQTEATQSNSKNPVIAENTDQTNFIFKLEEKLASFPNINKYIISSNHDIKMPNETSSNYAHQINQETKTQYFANLEDGQTDFSFLEFNVDNDSNVSFKHTNRNNK